jgi:hypothetical protein
MSRELKSLVRLAVIWVVCLVVLAVFHFALVAPQARALAADHQRAADKAERFRLLSDAKSARGQQRLREEQEQLEQRYTDFVFTSEQMNDLDFRIRALAEKNGIHEFSARHVETVTKIRNKELKGIAQRNLVLSMTSTFPQFLQFLNELERNQPLVLVDQFTLQTATAGKQVGLSGTMECAILYQKAGPEPPPKTTGGGPAEAAPPPGK